MTLNKISIAIALIISMTACHSTKKIVAEKSICKPIQLVKAYAPSTLDYNIDSCYLEKSCLHFSVSYSGCATDTFDLQWNRIMMKSFPPQLHMKLVANQTKDCAPMHQQQSLCIAIDTLANYPGISGSSVLIIEKWEERIRFEKP